MRRTPFAICSVATFLLIASSFQVFAQEQKVIVGGVPRPKSDIQKRQTRIQLDRETDRVKKGAEERQKVGKQPALALDAHPTITRLHETLKKGGRNTFGMHVEAPAFDFEAFKKDRDDYAGQFAPNRVYQAAQPGPNVPVLSPISSSTHSMIAGEAIRLQVKTAPGYPATYVSLDLGTFQNKLNAITVIADKEGVAEVLYTATPGTVNRSHVLVGSPGASGQACFEIRISLPSSGASDAK